MAKQPKKPDLDMSEKPVNEYQGDGTKEDHSEFLMTVRENQVYAESAWNENYNLARAEVRFANLGEQWDAEALEERMRANRPAFTFNDIPQYLDQVIGDIRLNRPSIHVAPADDASKTDKMPNTTGGKNYSVAEVYEGLIRNIEQTSGAEAHYDTAAQHAVEAGFGWLRVISTFESPKSFDHDLRVKSVANRWSVLIDPDAEEPDFSDANFCFIADTMSRHAFDKLYPDAAVGSLVEVRDWWGTSDRVCVAEYFERYAVERELLMLDSGEVTYSDLIPDIMDELEEKGAIVARRKIDTYKIRWWKLTANSVLRGPVDMPCSTIPVVPVLGKETNIDGRKDFRGLIRFAQDPKQADNYWMTAAAERVAMAPKAPYMVTASMIEGHQNEWEGLSSGNPAVLVYTPDPMAPGAKPTREMPAPMPAAELQMAATMADKVKSTMGMYGASLGQRTNETSGKAIKARQSEADVGNFTFPDNLARSIRRVGLLLVEMIPAVYDADRVIRIRHEDGEGDWVQINRVERDDETGKDVVISDLSLGSYDVVVKSGPSYSTQREEASQHLMEFMRVAPGIGALIVDKVADAMDWPGARAIGKRLLHTIPDHVLTEEELEERGPKPEPQPSPEDMANMKEAEAKIAAAQATMAMAEAKTAEAQAKMAEIEHLADTNQFVEIIRDAVAEAMADVMSAQQTNKEGK